MSSVSTADAVIAVPIDKAAKMCGIGRTTLYESIKSGDLRTVKIGARRVVPVEWIREWLRRREASAST